MTVRIEEQSASPQIRGAKISNQQQARYANGANGATGTDSLSIQMEPPPADRADLPTFPMDVGWRERYDPETGICHRSPLTLLDLLYPTEDDIGVVTMAQSYLHDLWLSILVSIFRGYLLMDKWLVTSDVLIFWHRGNANPAVPDIAVIPKGKQLDEENKSYHVGVHGPVPPFVLEITSQDTRDTDLNAKRISYAAMGVREYLIVDIESPKKEDWALLGYRLGDTPYYEPITPDAEGGLTFETIGYRFTSSGRSEVAVYDAESGERLLKLDEQQIRAKRAEENAARTQEENDMLRAEVERLKAQVEEKKS